jgi:hypothetical protein
LFECVQLKAQRYNNLPFESPPLPIVGGITDRIGDHVHWRSRCWPARQRKRREIPPCARCTWRIGLRVDDNAEESRRDADARRSLAGDATPRDETWPLFATVGPVYIGTFPGFLAGYPFYRHSPSSFSSMGPEDFCR